MRLLALLQMTYVGAPMIYYGDEAGMWGADDPSNRKPMLWKDLEPYADPDENHVMDDQLAFYRSAIKLRREHPALSTGSFQSLLTDDAKNVWAFERVGDHEQIVVVLNAAEADAKVVLGIGFESHFQCRCRRGRDVYVHQHQAWQDHHRQGDGSIRGFTVVRLLVHGWSGLAESVTAVG